ncbi:MAG: hypothetical protein H6703_08800 [Myxococcales bacterium]|nr:hypothetical protein [Myxococcales bacterium]MCB9552817.1 hypothetical protein [Myxococcales bacterium]
MAEETTATAGAVAAGAVAADTLSAAQREDRRMHLDHLQGIIGRLSQLGFMMKGWAITFTGGMLAVIGDDAPFAAALLGLGGVGIFWFLDAWLLAMERRFRRRYEAAATAWDGRLALSACLAQPAPIDRVEVFEAGGGFTGWCYRALLVGSIVGAAVLSLE